MGNGKKNNDNVLKQRIAAVVILAAVCVFLVVLTGNRNRLREVRINRLPGNYLSVSDDEIIRASGLTMGAQIPSIAEMKEKVENSVNATGIVKFEDIKRVSSQCIEITVSAREAIAVIDSAGNYVLIDKDGYVMDIRTTLPTERIIYVKGTDIQTQEKGRKFVCYDEEKLNAIIEIALAIKNGGFSDTYDELNVKNKNDILLITAGNSQIIEIFDGSNISQKLLMVDELLKSGNTKGRISVSGDYAAYQPPEGG